MTSRSLNRALFCGVLAWGLEARAQVPPSLPESEHQAVGIYDLLGGHIGDGQLIETTGSLQISAHGAFLSASMPSAMAPIRVDVANVSQEDFSKLVQECFAHQLAGGCQATIQGQTGRLDNRQAIFATGVSLHNDREPAR